MENNYENEKELTEQAGVFEEANNETSAADSEADASKKNKGKKKNNTQTRYRKKSNKKMPKWGVALIIIAVIAVVGITVAQGIES